MPREFFIPKPVQVVFVADLFAEDYVGGAELTTEAILTGSPLRTFKLHSESLTENLVKQNKDKTFVLCNWCRCPSEGIVALVNEKCKYFVVEYDYKYCKYRSSHLHMIEAKEECRCHLQKQGKFVEQLYKRAQHVFFMSEGQQNEYNRFLPTLATAKNSSVLSSVWTPEDFATLKILRDSRTSGNGKWAVLTGGSWIKAQEATERYCKANSIDYDLIGNLPYLPFLETLSKYKGLVFHPAGFDTCPRLVVESKLMGLKLDLNGNVQHKDEQWFSGSPEQAEEYLKTATDRFWSKIAL